jgi:hypothetical protein
MDETLCRIRVGVIVATNDLPSFLRTTRRYSGSDGN